MEPEPGESAAVEAALAAWRGKAANILLAASAAVHLPLAILASLGAAPTVGLGARSAGIAAYMVLLAAALLRRFDSRKRLWAFFIPGYLVTALANFAGLKGVYAHMGLVCHPILALALRGPLAGRIAAAVSAAIIVSAPFLRIQPAMMRMMGTDPAPVAEPAAAVLFQAVGKLAFLAAVMTLLDFFHRFLMDTLAAQCRGMRERQLLERRIAAAGDEERRRLGRELHDGVCQQVTAALLRCRALARRADRGQTVAGADFDPLSSLLAESIEEARNVAHGLCPLEPEPDALAPALRALAHRMHELGSVRCEFLTAGDVRVPDPAMAQHLYRIAQEALSNALRHAHASRIAVELRGTESELMLQVEDDGTGLPAERPAGGMGLRTMAYRAQVLGGELAVTPGPAGGTRVSCRVPRVAGAPAGPQPPGDQRWIPTT